MVFEVDLDGKVIHLKSLEKPESAKKAASVTTTQAISSLSVLDEDIKMDDGNETEHPVQETTKKEAPITSAPNHEAESFKNSANDGSWHDHFNVALSPFLSKEAIFQVKNMYLEGREPPRVSDAGWAGRSALSAGDREEEAVSDATAIVPVLDERQGNSRGGSRGKRGGRGGRGRGGASRMDHRKVLSNVSLASKFLICVS